MANALAAVLALFDDVSAVASKVTPTADLASNVIALSADDMASQAGTAVVKTAPVAVDDAAAGAASVTSGKTPPNREWPIVWRIFMGSLVNKAIIIPIALLLSIFAPYTIAYLLIAGGLYLSYGGAEKIAEYFGDHESASLFKNEDEKVKHAIKIDFVLSVEIVVVALSALQDMPFQHRSIILTMVVVGISIAIYGAIAILVKIDDLGMHLRDFTKYKKIGKSMVSAAPKIMGAIAAIGTFAMFLVAGSLFEHNITTIHHFNEMINIANSTWYSSMAITIQVIESMIVGLILIGIHKLFQKEPND